MTVLFAISPEAVSISHAANKDSVLQELGSRFAKIYDLDAKLVLEKLLEREKLGSTGFGRRVAIPHARIAGLNGAVAVFMRLETPVQFEAADGMPIDIVFGLLSPDKAGATHLHALAAISRMMRDENLRSALTQANGPEAIYALLCNTLDPDVRG